ncbi:MAG: hypothetical protein ABH896_04965 [Candidatus Jacksonbacteria bacterium]
MPVKSKQTIYLETSVISAYFDFWGKSPKQKQETRKFWREILPKYNAVISSVTLVELQEAKPLWRIQYLKFIDHIKNVKLSDQTIELTKKYIKQGIIPKSKRDDATHLAMAVVNKMDFFLTWNMQHFLRPNKLKQISDFNRKNNLHSPILIKPSYFFE